MHSGSCACGAVKYELHAPLRPSVACHCVQCRKVSGHYWSATAVPKAALKLVSARTLKWYRSSPHVRRGFCGNCGSTLFWDNEERDSISIGSGTLDQVDGLTTSHHIFIAEKGTYYDLPKGMPRYPGSGPEAGKGGPP